MARTISIFIMFVWGMPALVTARLDTPNQASSGTGSQDRPAQIRNNGVNPVEAFRHLLAMTPAERNQALAGKSEPSKKAIFAKIRQYEALRPDQREMKLRVTELRWHMSRLMNAPATNRLIVLQRIDDRDRKILENRLEVWDKLGPEVQKQLIGNLATMSYFTELNSGSSSVPVSVARHLKLQKGLAEWQKLSGEDRERTLVGR